MFITKRRQYSTEFKREAVKLTQQPGVSCSLIAIEIGVAQNLLSRWNREAARDKAFQDSGNPRDEEVACLERKLTRVTKEWDFLRELAAYFAKSQT